MAHHAWRRENSIIKCVTERDQDIQRQYQYNKIQNSRYCGYYKRIWDPRVPRYLQKRGTNGNQKIIARFRLGNEENSNKYWLKEEQRACRVCSWEEETLEHIWRFCVGP